MQPPVFCEKKLSDLGLHSLMSDVEFCGMNLHTQSALEDSVLQCKPFI